MFPTTLRHLAVTLILLVAAALAPQAMAQGLGKASPGIVADQQEVIESLTHQVDELEKKMTQNAEDDARLVDIRLQLEELSRKLLDSGLAFRPRLAEINARIDQLGPPPVEGQPPEPEIVTSERQVLVAEKAEINAVLGVAENLSIRVSGLITHIADMRRALFQNLLTKRYNIDYKLVFEVLEAFEAEVGDFYRVVASWLRFVVTFKLSSVLAAAFFAVASAVVLQVGGRRLFGSVFEADPTVEDPSYLSRLSVAFWSTLLPTAALVVFLGVTYFLFDYFDVLRDDIRTLMTSLFYVIAIVFFVYRLARAILAPQLPNWRLIQVESRAAHSLVLLILATAFFTGVDYFLSTTYQVLGSPLSLTVGEALASTVIIGILVILIARVKPFVDNNGQSRPWPRTVRYILLFLGGVTIAAALLGYVGFARFVSQQIVVTGAILATMYIGFLSSQAISDEGAFADTTVGKRFQGWLNLDAMTLDQLGLVISIVINILVLVIGVPLILFQWGFQPGDMTTWLYKIAGGFKVGTFTFSPSGILTGILVFLFGYFLTRWFQSWLDGSVMARGKVDAGVRNSIRVAVGYAGIALASLMAISAAGIDLSNLALVAGALSLGIGFGLQNVVSNFVSGLILLAERPFKVGDWIVAGQTSGTVKKISVRATEIETFQRQSVILPNSELINSAVGNWTHHNKLGRVDIKVGVAYSSDAKRAHAIMLDVARSHHLVLKNPEPFVLFANFGPAALEFEIRVFLADVGSGNIAQNDIRFAVLEAFEREHIEIPSTPRAHETTLLEKWPTDDDKIEADYAEAETERQKRAPATQGKRKPKKPDPD